MTGPGKGILKIIDRLLVEAENLQQASQEYADQDSGTLTIAVTHTQARYALPQVVQSFRAAFPGVRIALQQSAPEHIAEWVLSGKADIGIATEGLSAFPDLVSFPCYRWSHVVVVPEGHPLLSVGPITLEHLAQHPLITYDIGFTGRGHIDDAFARAGVEPDIVLTAMDSDVIKQYVALGMGVGIVASMAFDHGRDRGMRAVEASHLFAPNVTRLGVRRGAFLKGVRVSLHRAVCAGRDAQRRGTGAAGEHRGLSITPGPGPSAPGRIRAPATGRDRSGRCTAAPAARPGGS